MKSVRTSIERLERLRRCCDAYGADPARWPDLERLLLADSLDTDEAAEMRAEAETLDAFLNAATAPQMSEDLTRRLAASYVPPAGKTGWIERMREFLPTARLIPVGAFAGLAALGLATGIATAQPTLTPEGEALAYIDALPVAALDENGGLQWDAE